MRKLSRAIDHFCYTHSNFGIVGLMRYITIANVAVYFLDLLSNGILSRIISFVPSYIFSGQIWRLVTFVAVPTVSGSSALSLLSFAITTWLYYSIGTALEQRWGSTRFSVFYGLGVIFSVIGGLLLVMLNNAYMPYSTASMSYVNLSMFLAFATLYPELQFYLFAIIPIKAKWMGYLAGAQYAFSVIATLISGNIPLALMAVLALLQYFLFFWDEICGVITRGKSKSNYRKNPQVVNFKKAQKDLQERKGYLHKCTICGITDASHPDMEFRYCSKCKGYHCFCADHINHHIHIE